MIGAKDDWRGHSRNFILRGFQLIGVLLPCYSDQDIAPSAGLAVHGVFISPITRDRDLLLTPRFPFKSRKFWLGCFSKPKVRRC
jgi:hypothetical protein